MESAKVAARRARQRRVRKKVFGTDACPRLSVYRSLRYIYVQVISDHSRRTLAAASTLEKDLRKDLASTRNLEAARRLGKVIAERCAKLGISKVVFDRNGFRYHGRVSALADAAREAGLKF